MITIEDLRNPARQSGFDYVRQSLDKRSGRTNPAPFAAVHQDSGGYRKLSWSTPWRGPRRATAEEAAQDYCDYVNGTRGPRVLHVPDPQVDDWARRDGTCHPRHTGTAPRAPYTVEPRETKSTEGQFMDEPAAREIAARLVAEGYDVEWLAGAPNEHAGRMLYRQSITGRPHALLCRGVPDDPRWVPFWSHHFRIELVA
jgi:hypothetical protein